MYHAVIECQLMLLSTIFLFVLRALCKPIKFLYMRVWRVCRLVKNARSRMTGKETNKHKFLHSAELMGIVFDILVEDKRTLRNAVQVCRLWFDAGVPILWSDATPEELARWFRDNSRRQHYARFVRKLSICHCLHGGMPNSIGPVIPRFTGIQHLKLHETPSLVMIEAFIGPALRTLTIPANDGCIIPLAKVAKADDNWLTALQRESTLLSALNMDFPLMASEARLFGFFTHATNLTHLVLGRQLTNVLTDEILAVVLKLEKLESLILHKPITPRTMELVQRGSGISLRYLRKAFLICSGRAGVAAGTLLGGALSLEYLNIVLMDCSRSWNWSKHDPAVFQAIGALSKLKLFHLSIDRSIILKDPDLIALGSLSQLDYLIICVKWDPTLPLWDPGRTVNIASSGRALIEMLRGMTSLTFRSIRLGGQIPVSPEELEMYRSLTPDGWWCFDDRFSLVLVEEEERLTFLNRQETRGEQ